MTFDELVTTTHTILNAKARDSAIHVDTVRRVLEASDVADAMQRSNVAIPERRIIVRQIWLRGRKWQDNPAAATEFTYRRFLVPGMNGWVAGNGAGKSTLLKTIVWALTGVAPSFKADVRAWLEDIAVELEITGDGIYTIRYRPRTGQPKVTGEIYNHALDAVLNDAGTLTPLDTFVDSKPMSRAITAFFTERMGFFELEAVEWRAATFSSVRRVVSWEVYAQALFIGAEDYADYLFPRRDTNAKQHQNTLAMLLGLDVIAAVSRLKAKWDQAKGDFEFQKKRVEANTADVRGRITQAEQQLRQVEARIAAIDAGQSVVVDATHVIHVRERIAHELQRISTLTETEQALLAEERRIKADLGKTRRDAQVLREIVQFRFFFSGLPVERCPHCEQGIAQERVAQEQDTGLCRLCGSDLHPATSTEQQEVALDAVDRRIDSLDQTLRILGRDVRVVHRDIEAANAAVKQLQAELGDLPRQEQAGFTNELRELLAAQGFWKGQLAELNAQTTEGQSERLQELQLQRDIYQVAYQTLQNDVNRDHRAILDTLGERTTSFAQSFGIRNLDRISFNPQFEMLITQAGKTNHYTDMEMSEALRIKIAFHLALLTLRSASGVGRHPGLLIADAPGNGEMDPERLGAIVQGFATLKEQLGDQVQILIATTKAELADICDENAVQIIDPSATLF